MHPALTSNIGGQARKRLLAGSSDADKQNITALHGKQAADAGEVNKRILKQHKLKFSAAALLIEAPLKRFRPQSVIKINMVISINQGDLLSLMIAGIYDVPLMLALGFFCLMNQVQTSRCSCHTIQKFHIKQLLFHAANCYLPDIRQAAHYRFIYGGVRIDHFPSLRICDWLA